MTFKLTVVLCTHNPDPKNISAAINSLRVQTKAYDQWEFILIDNCSSLNIDFEALISWHPHTRYVREEKLGLVHARIRAMSLAQSDLILFIDDDNELFEDYIESGLKIAEDFPLIGSWGGQLLPKFESPAPDWTKPWWPYLAIRPLEKDLFYSIDQSDEAIPPGAGMFVRRKVWETYLSKVSRDDRHLIFGVSGDRRMSGEDTDLVLTALDLDLDIGRFKKLELNHRIAAVRITEDYILRVIHSAAYSKLAIDLMRGNSIPDSAKKRWKFFIEIMKAKRLPARQKRFYEAELNARRKAWLDFRKISFERN